MRNRTNEQRKTHEGKLSRIDEAEKHLRSLIDEFAAKPPRTEPIRFLGNLAQDLWAETNQGRFPRSYAPDGPLCRLMEPALTAISANRPRATISAVLRKRRRQPKEDNSGYSVCPPD